MDVVDSAELNRIAARLDAHAEQLQQRGRRLGVAAATTRWDSRAAAVCRARVADLRRQADDGADGLRGAAQALRRHACAAAAAQRALAGAEHAAGRVLTAIGDVL